MTDEHQSWDQPSSLYDTMARSSPNSHFGDYGLLEEYVAVVDSGPTISRSTPPPFRPVLEGRLFTAHDSIIEADEEVHPTARLLYDSLPQNFRDVFKNCPMYLEKHLELVKYLRHLSLNDLDKKNEPSSEKNLIKNLGIPISTEEGDKKKWQCGVVGCKYRGTLQHLVSHLRTKSHIGIPTFACTLYCKILFHHSQDRDRHVKEKICLKSHQAEDAAEPQGSTRSRRGVGVATATKPKISAQGANDLRTRKAVHYDPSFQVPGNGGHYGRGIPSTSFVHPQAFGTPLHQTNAYNQTHSNVPTAQDGHLGMHPPSHPLFTPDIFRTPSILSTNNGGMHATVITNNNHVHGTVVNSPPTNNPHFTPGSQPVNQPFNNQTYAYPNVDPRVTTGYHGAGQSSTSHSADFAGDFYDEDPPEASHGRLRDSRQPPPYVVKNQGHSSRRNQDGGKKD